MSEQGNLFDARLSDPITSHQAAVHARQGDRFAHLTLQLYAEGRTDEEAARRSGILFGVVWHPGTTAKRRYRLTEKGGHPVGLIEDSGEVRPTTHQSDAIVWRLTDAGEAALDTYLENR